MHQLPKNVSISRQRRCHCLLEKIVVKDMVFLSPLSVSTGIAGFFPLHPMTITEAERQRAKAMLTETATGTEDGQEEAKKEAEVWELKLGTVCDCPEQKDVTVMWIHKQLICVLTCWVDWRKQHQIWHIVVVVALLAALNNSYLNWVLFELQVLILRVECHNRQLSAFTVLFDLNKVFHYYCICLMLSCSFFSFILCATLTFLQAIYPRMSRSEFVLFLFNLTSEPWNHSSFCGVRWFFFWPACIWMWTHESIVNVSDVEHKKRKKSEVGGFVDTMIGKFYNILYLFGQAFSTLSYTVCFGNLCKSLFPHRRHIMVDSFRIP